MYKNILAATDMVAVCATAVLTAAEIAKQKDAKLYILHVLESAYSGKYRHFVKHFRTGEEIVSTAEYEETVKQELEKACAEILKPISSYKIKVTPGLPWEQILKWAREEHVDLVVQGPHSGRAEEKRVARVSGTIGSTAEGVIMHARCPVMIINRPIPEEKLKFKKVMVCVDFSRSCEFALQFATKLAQKHSAKLFVFHMLGLSVISPRYPQEELETEIGKTKQRLETFCEEIPQGIACEYRVWEGNLPHVEILKYAREKDVDLIAMSSHSKGNAERWYVGSAVEQVSSRALCPVVIVTDPKAILKMED
jgi:nucleotide-binding universal stress UspA family protein